jgi:hypothetical protein
LVNAIRNAVRKIDKDYTKEMRGGNGISLMRDFLEQIGESVHPWLDSPEAPDPVVGDGQNPAAGFENFFCV